MASSKKQLQLDSITSFLNSSTNFVLVRFEKTTHGSFEKLRKELRKSDAKMMVVKNTILQKSINKLASDKKSAHLRSLQKFTRTLKDNTAVIGLGQDWSDAMKVFHTFTKTNANVTFKVGSLDTTTYGADDLLKISKLPGKSELIGKIIGSMKAPAASLTRALTYNAQQFVYLLNAMAKKA